MLSLECYMGSLDTKGMRKFCGGLYPIQLTFSVTDRVHPRTVLSKKRRTCKHLVDHTLCTAGCSNEVVLMLNHAWYKHPHFSHGVCNLLGFSGCQLLSPPLISAGLTG